MCNIRQRRSRLKLKHQKVRAALLMTKVIQNARKQLGRTQKGKDLRQEQTCFKINFIFLHFSSIKLSSYLPTLSSVKSSPLYCRYLDITIYSALHFHLKLICILDFTWPKYKSLISIQTCSSQFPQFFHLCRPSILGVLSSAFNPPQSQQ